MNQFILGPIVLTTVFSWNLILQNQPRRIPEKIKEDLVPGAINGMQSVTVPSRCRPLPQLTWSLLLQGGSSGCLLPPSTSGWSP